MEYRYNTLSFLPCNEVCLSGFLIEAKFWVKEENDIVHIMMVGTY